MTRFTVQITQTALDQIEAQVHHIAKDSVENALGWESRVMEALHRLGDYHGLSIDQDARKRTGGEPRKLVFEATYIIHYEVDAASGRVTVINFRHGRRRPASLPPDQR